MMAPRRLVIFNSILFIILCSVCLNVAKGAVEDWQINVVKGDTGECSGKFQFETVNASCNITEPCQEGPQGPPGFKGEKGDRGERGETGERGKCEVRGTKSNPAISCVDSDIKDCPYIFPPSPFNVQCDNVNNKICFNNTQDILKIDELFNTTKEKPYWLWPEVNKKSFFQNFYGLDKYQISHLISISERVALDMIFHCRNFELKDNLRILLWNNNLIGVKPTIMSLTTYHVPEEENGCQNFYDPSEWRTATISIETWSGAAKNFYIPAKTLDSQRFYIQFRNICFYF